MCTTCYHVPCIHSGQNKVFGISICYLIFSNSFVFMYIHNNVKKIYRVIQEESIVLWENVPYVKLH